MRVSVERAGSYFESELGSANQVDFSYPHTSTALPPLIARARMVNGPDHDWLRIDIPRGSFEVHRDLGDAVTIFIEAR